MKQINELIKKSLAVHASCTTREQLVVAGRYAVLVDRWLANMKEKSCK
jgi:hypothetical protein